MKRNIGWIAGIAALFLLTGCGVSEEPKDSYRQIPMAEAAKIMEEETGYILLDVRTQAEYDQGHIPGAVCIPNETIGTEELPELPDKEQKILVYCRSGNRSKQAAAKLVQLGYGNVVEIGGINSWPGEIVTGE